MTNPEKSVEEIVEEFDQMLIVHQSNARVIELLDKPNVQIKLPEVREWLPQTLQAERQKREEVVEEAKRVATIEAWNDAIELSDKLEEGNTKFDEWRAFKGFRNGLRDRIRELVTLSNMKEKDSIEINGITFTVKTDEQKIAPGEFNLTPRYEMRFDENGEPYHVNVDTEEAIINMINGTQPNNPKT